MDRKDYSELTLLLKGAEQALLSGGLSEIQHISTTTFHLLAQFILDLNERLSRFEKYADDHLGDNDYSTNQPVQHAETGIIIDRG